MININNILNYVGLRAPTSPSEAFNNMKNNSIKLLKITTSAILGISSIFAGFSCHECPLCIPINPSTQSSSSHNLLKNILVENNHHSQINIRCIPTIISNTIISGSIGYTLLVHERTLCTKALINKKKLAFTFSIIKTVMLTCLIMAELYSILECMVDIQKTTLKNDIICSKTTLMSTLLGTGYCSYALIELLLLLLPSNLPPLPESIEMTLLTPLRSETDHPLQSTTTQLLDLLGRVDQIFVHLLDQILDDSSVTEENIELMLNKALYLFQKIKPLLIQKLGSHGQSYTLEINELSLISQNITSPSQPEHNITSISIILARLHALIRNLVSLCPIAAPAEIQLALPSFQALCPPPEYSEENMPEINTSATSHPLYLASPPSYEEYSPTVATSS
ncbi:hypothetical protein CLAVI_000491 [Candidatus Clavichlamydia salmonicola]|uniref:hypothetical protein n=1 Tax=Candidatus Clavichlamydia salmonicola TaxID=469812 RepID=UPI00189175DB|nr:hypothetical protein [Candidatus Clavichlamydia salmonicola]MBF5050869.1 hypothetical protein [Candidatus Clavichlamydia salmonicola]